MKTKALVLAALLTAGITSTVIAKSNHTNNEVMSKLPDGTYVVNTTTLAKDVRGFQQGKAGLAPEMERHEDSQGLHPNSGWRYRCHLL